MYLFDDGLGGLSESLDNEQLIDKTIYAEDQMSDLLTLPEDLFLGVDCE